MVLRLTVHALALAAGLLARFHPTLLSGFERMQADAGDTVLNNYILEHAWLWLADPSYRCPFWSPAFFYPTPNVLTYSETLIGAAPFYWALRTAFDESLGYQLWQMLMYALNYGAAAWVLGRWGVPRPWAVGLAWVFAFGLVRVGQINHQSLFPQFYSALALYRCGEFLERPSPRAAFRAGFWVCAQCLASVYLGWFLAFGLGLALLFLLLFDRGRLLPALRFARGRPLVCLGLTILLALPMAAFFAHYLRGNETPRGYYEAAFYLPHPSSWLTGPPGSLWEYGWELEGAPKREELQLNNGLALMLLYAAGIRAAVRLPPSEDRARLRLLLGTAAALVLLSLRITERYSLWEFVFRAVPGANALRAVGRIGLMVHLLGLLAVGVAAKHSFALRGPRWLPAALLLAMLAEQVGPHLPSFPKAESYAAAKGLAAAAEEWDVVYVDRDPARRGEFGRVTAMWAGLYARRPVVNGYSGRLPPHYPPVEAPTDRALLEFVRPGPGFRFGRLSITPDGISARPVRDKP